MLLLPLLLCVRSSQFPRNILFMLIGRVIFRFFSFFSASVFNQERNQNHAGSGDGRNLQKNFFCTTRNKRPKMMAWRTRGNCLLISSGFPHVSRPIFCDFSLVSVVLGLFCPKMYPQKSPEASKSIKMCPKSFLL